MFKKSLIGLATIALTSTSWGQAQDVIQEADLTQRQAQSYLSRTLEKEAASTNYDKLNAGLKAFIEDSASTIEKSKIADSEDIDKDGDTEESIYSAKFDQDLAEKKAKKEAEEKSLLEKKEQAKKLREKTFNETRDAIIKGFSSVKYNKKKDKYEYTIREKALTPAEILEREEKGIKPTGPELGALVKILENASKVLPLEDLKALKDDADVQAALDGFGIANHPRIRAAYKTNVRLRILALEQEQKDKEVAGEVAEKPVQQPEKLSPEQITALEEATLGMHPGLDNYCPAPSELSKILTGKIEEHQAKRDLISSLNSETAAQLALERAVENNDFIAIAKMLGSDEIQAERVLPLGKEGVKIEDPISHLKELVSTGLIVGKADLTSVEKLSFSGKASKDENGNTIIDRSVLGLGVKMTLSPKAVEKLNDSILSLQDKELVDALAAASKEKADNEEISKKREIALADLETSTLNLTKILDCHKQIEAANAAFKDDTIESAQSARTHLEKAETLYREATEVKTVEKTEAAK
jgi:hypothetical protein